MGGARFDTDLLTTSQNGAKAHSFGAKNELFDFAGL
jgi:hypothetical protein